MKTYAEHIESMRGMPTQSLRNLAYGFRIRLEGLQRRREPVRDVPEMLRAAADLLAEREG